MTDWAQDILNWQRDNVDVAVETLVRLAAMESPTGDRKATLALLEAFGGELEAIGFDHRTDQQLDGTSVMTAWPKSGTVDAQPAQLILGHVDTSWPAGTIDAMPVLVSADRVYGPGVLDMKAGLVIALFALRALASFGVALPLQPVLFLNSDQWLERRSSVACIEKIARRAMRVFVMEPAQPATGKLTTSRKGLGRFSLAVQDRSAHGELAPEAGLSAILELSHVIQQLHDLNDPGKGISVNVGMLDTEIRPGAILPTSRARIDVRVDTEADGRAITQRIRGLRPRDPQTAIAIKGGMERPPMEATTGNRALWHQAVRHAERLGLQVAESAASTPSDANTASRFAPTIDGLGGVGDGLNDPSENVLIASIAERAALLALLLSSDISASS